MLPQQMTKEDMTLIKVILSKYFVLDCISIPNQSILYPLNNLPDLYLQVAFCRVLGTLFCYGYDVVIASDLSRDATAHSTVFFRLRDPRHDYLPLHYYSHKVKNVKGHQQQYAFIFNTITLFILLFLEIKIV